MAERRIVQFVGDGVNGRWVTWRWAGGVAEGGVQRLPEFGEWTNRLRAALPAADAQGSLAAVRLDGALSVPEQERVLRETTTARGRTTSQGLAQIDAWLDRKP